MKYRILIRIALLLGPVNLRRMKMNKVEKKNGHTGRKWNSKGRR